MCKFCDALLDENKEINWKVRSTCADDNICEIMTTSHLDKKTKEAIYGDKDDPCYNPVDCSRCRGCESSFSLSGYKDSKDNVRVGLEFYQKVCDTIVHPFSETIPFNFCPICGKQISKNISKFEDLEYPIDIIENE